MIIKRFPQVLNLLVADGASPLHVAVRNGDCQMVEFILGFYNEYRCKVTPNLDIDKKTRTDQTALHIACLEGHLSIAKVLLHHGARIDAETQSGMTAVLMCIKKHQLLKYLPQLGGSEETPDVATVCYSIDLIKNSFTVDSS